MHWVHNLDTVCQHGGVCAEKRAEIDQNKLSIGGKPRVALWSRSKKVLLRYCGRTYAVCWLRVVAQNRVHQAVYDLHKTGRHSFLLSFG